MIDGGMTFYFDGDDIDLNIIKDFTCETLNDDDFRQLVGPTTIEDLKCITGSAGGYQGNKNNSNEPGAASPGFSSVRFAPPFVACVAAFFVVFGVYAYRRRQNPEDDVPEKANLDDSDLNNSNSISFDDVPMAWSTQTKPGVPAFDLQSIIPKGYSPETIDEHPEEDSLDEVSLDQLNMNVDDSDLSS